MNNLKLYIGLGITLLGFAVGYGALQTKVDRAVKVEEEVKEVERRLDENEKVDIRQSVIQERTVQVLEKLEAKF